MKKNKFIFIFVILLSLLLSCKKIDNEVAGKGGHIENQNIEDDAMSKNDDVENIDKEENIDEINDIDELELKINEMTVDEKIGQLIISGFEGSSISDEVKSLISDYKVSGFILFSRNIKSIEQTKQLLNELKYENSNNTYPLFLSVDEEGGRVKRMPSEYITLPTALEVGKKDSEIISRRFGEILGERVKSLGFNLDFAPVLDIFSNSENTVIGDRAFGKNAESVINNSIFVMEGIREKNIIPSAKHFPGHGDTSIDSHLSLPKVEKTLEELRLFELQPFEYAIENNVEMIMIAHILYPYIDENYPSSMSSEIIDNILRDELGYSGVIISDDMTMGAIIENYTVEEATLQFLKAGGDISLICHGEQNTINAINGIKKAVERGEISKEKLDEKVYRILELKEDYNLEDKIIDKVDIESLKKITTEFLEEFK